MAAATSEDEKTTSTDRELTQCISEQSQLDLIALYENNLEEFERQSAGLLRDNAKLLNTEQLKSVADEQNRISLTKFQSFFEKHLQIKLSALIWRRINVLDVDDDEHIALQDIAEFMKPLENDDDADTNTGQQEPKDAQQLIAKLKAELIAKEKLISERETKAKQVEKERDELQSTIQELSGLFEEMTIKAAEKDDKIEKLRDENKRLKKKNKNLSIELSEEETGNQALNETIRDLQGKLDVRRKSTITSRDVAGLTVKIARLEQLLQQSQEKSKEHEKLKKDTEELTKLFRELQAEIKTKNDQIEEFQKELGDLQMEYNQSLTANETLKLEIDELQVKYEMIRSQEGTKANLVRLSQAIEEKDRLIRKLTEDEQDRVIQQLKEDEHSDDVLVKQLELTYQVVNEELREDHANLITDPEALRKSLQKLKSKAASRRQSKTPPVPRYQYSDSDFDSESEQEKPKDFTFGSLFVWLKDF